MKASSLLGGAANEWTFPCIHPNYLNSSKVHDFSLLATGAVDAPHPGTAHKWLGGYSGRPGLLADLMPVIRASFGARTIVAGNALRNELASFWRFLDGYEGLLSEKCVPFKAVAHLHDVTSTHLTLYSEPGPDGRWRATNDTRARSVRALIRDAIANAGGPALFMPAISDRRSRKETPPDDAGLELIRFLKQEALEIFARWRRSDQLLLEGRNLLAIKREPHPGRGRPALPFVPTEADAFVTYRAVSELTGHPLPTSDMVVEALGLTAKRKGMLPEWWPRFPSDHTDTRIAGQLVKLDYIKAGLYPTSRDVCNLFLLFIARSAWNPATAAGIDAENWQTVYDDDNRWLFARKPRAGGAYQSTISRANDSTGCYAIVQALLSRCAPLRARVKDFPDETKMPDVAARSPWVGVSLAAAPPIFAINPYETASANNHLTAAITTLSGRSALASSLLGMTAGDFRDLAAAIIYKDSHYSTWIAQLLLGHRSPATFHRYGYRAAGARESFASVVHVMEDTFSQIEVRRRFDITLTRARLENIEVTAEAEARLAAARAHRTYDGSGCSDPTRPPKEIDPLNPQDGCTICVQQHRCAAAGCPNAFVFDDSLSLLCRRLAELEWNEARVGVTRFFVSSDAHDLQALRATLAQWPEADVRRLVDEWTERIKNGDHRPITLAGRH